MANLTLLAPRVATQNAKTSAQVLINDLWVALQADELALTADQKTIADIKAADAATIAGLNTQVAALKAQVADLTTRLNACLAGVPPPVIVPPPPPPPPPPPVGGALVHGQTFALAGAGFGSKAIAAPVIWDDGSVGTTPTDKGWDGYYPHYPDESTLYHLRYTAPIRGIALPHSHITRYLAGAHGETGGGGWQVIFWKNRTIAYPAHTFLSFYQRVDDAWVFGQDNNFKTTDFSAGSKPYDASNWYTNYEPPSFSGRTASPKWQLNDDAQNTPSNSLSDPDNNGHNLFWNFGSNSASGWSKIEMEIRWSNGPDGYVKLWDNGQPVVNYSGPTDRYSGVSRCEAIGGYARMYGQPNNWRYWADVYLDYSRARVMLTQGNLSEVQPLFAWNDTAISLKVNLGKIQPGAAAFKVFNEAGVQVGSFPVTV